MSTLKDALLKAQEPHLARQLTEAYSKQYVNFTGYLISGMEEGFKPIDWLIAEMEYQIPKLRNKETRPLASLKMLAITGILRVVQGWKLEGTK